MRFLSVNHLRLGSAPGGIPSHLASDSRAFSTRAAWQRAVALAVQHDVHAVLLSGQTLASTNTGLEPWGPLTDGLAELQQADIPVIAVANGAFTPHNLARFAPDEAVHWLDISLDWDPVFTRSKEVTGNPAVHVIDGALAESHETPVENPITLEQVDHPDTVWILTDPLQGDTANPQFSLLIEPGSTAPLTPHETGRHGAWLIDTEERETRFFPLASLEYASLDIDISGANDLDTFERIITEHLVDYANAARQDGSIAHLLVADITLTGSTRLYPALADTAKDLESMLVIEHDSMTIGIDNIAIDATPPVDLEPLVSRPDPVGEVARLITALDSGSELNEAQARLLTATEQKLLAISHARVFGSILDMEPTVDAHTLLRRQGWATLDALVRQRGID